MSYLITVLIRRNRMIVQIYLLDGQESTMYQSAEFFCGKPTKHFLSGTPFSDRVIKFCENYHKEYSQPSYYQCSIEVSEDLSAMLLSDGSGQFSCQDGVGSGPNGIGHDFWIGMKEIMLRSK